MHKKIIILIITFILFFVVIVFYMYKPISIEFTEVARVNTDEKLKGTWYTVITNEKQSIIQEYNIPISAVDFDKNYLLISGGREINQITYTRASKYITPYKGTYLGKEIYKKELNEHTLYVYIIKKIHLINNEQAELPATLRLEK